MGVNSTGLFYLFIFLPIYFLFTLVQRLYWLCSGKYDIISQIEAGQLYERSAHVLDIQWKVRREPFQLLSRNNYIATHRSFEHPSYVLRHNISLLSVQLDMAVFVEVPSSYDIFDCRLSPFVHLGQFDQAVRIITLPIPSLIQLGEELGDPTMDVIWLHSTGRCGSTALGQVFEVVPNCITLSEPMCLFTYRYEANQTMAFSKYLQFINSERFLATMKATVRLMCKPNAHNPDIMFIKNCTLTGVVEVPDLERMFPSHTHMFLFRDCLPTVQSYLRSLNSHFVIRLLLSLRRNALLRFTIRISHMFLQMFAPPAILEEYLWLHDRSLQLNMTAFGLLVLQWGALCAHYNMLYNAGNSKVRAIRYEDIIELKDETLSLMFRFCNISTEHVPAAKKSLETDSQEGTTLSRSQLGKHKKAHVTNALQAEADLYLKAFNLPRLGQPAFLSGMISPRAANVNCGLPSYHANKSAHIAIEIKA